MAGFSALLSSCFQYLKATRAVPSPGSGILKLLNCSYGVETLLSGKGRLGALSSALSLWREVGIPLHQLLQVVVAEDLFFYRESRAGP